MTFVQSPRNEFRVSHYDVRVFDAELAVFRVGFAFGFQVGLNGALFVGAEDEAADLFAGPERFGLTILKYV